MRRSLLLAFALGLFGLAQAQVTPQGNGYLLRYSFKKGQTWKYMISITARLGDTKAAPGMAPMNMPMTVSVLSVNGNQARVRVKGTGPNGQPMNRELTLDRRGAVVGKRDNAGLEDLGLLVYPEKPIPLNGTWTVSAQTNAGMGPMKIQNTFRLVRVQNGQATVATSGSGDMGTFGKMKLEGSVVITAANGALSSSKSTVKGQITMPGSSESKPTPFTAVTTVRRQ